MQITKALRRSLLLGVLTALLVLNVCGLASATEPEPGEDHVHYSNYRYYFFFVYPSCLQALPAPANGDGVQAVNKDLGLQVTASGHYNIMASTALGAIESMVPSGAKLIPQPEIAGDETTDMAAMWTHAGYVNWVRARIMPPLQNGEEERLVTVYVKYPQKNESRCRKYVESMMFTLVDIK